MRCAHPLHAGARRRRHQAQDRVAFPCFHFHLMPACRDASTTAVRVNKSNNSLKISVGLLLAVALVGCKPEVKPDPQMAISGQVFIRTKGGENVKLGAVRLHVVPAALAAEREAKAKAEYEADMATAKAAYEAWEAARVQAEIAAQVVWRKAKAVRDEQARLEAILFNNAKGMTALPAKDRERVAEANRECMARLKVLEVDRTAVADEETKAQAAVTAVKQRAPAAPDEMLSLVPRLMNIKWPEAAAEAVTDAEGRFAANTKSNTWALVAKAVRPLPLTKNFELYFWRVPVPEGTQATVVLSDANAKSMTGYYDGTKKLDRD